MYRYLLKRDTLLATILVFLVIGLFTKLEKELSILDPKEISSKDFDYNDLAFNLLNKHTNIATDTGIYIVNIGDADRKGIAKIIDQVSLAQPKVIGIDVLFDHPTNRDTDAALTNVFAHNKRIVMAYQLDSVAHHTHNYFYNKAVTSGYVNFTLDNQNVIRQFSPYIGSPDSSLSFAATIVKISNLPQYNLLIARRNSSEPINYTRSEDKFIIIQGADVKDHLADLKGKIVLLGYLSTGSNYEDKHFTPLNAKLTGKAMPDLSGVLIHANIVRMILDTNYIHQSPTWLNWLLAFVICWLHMAFFISYFIEKHIWFHLAAKLVQLISAIFFIFLSLFVFYSFNTQINMTQSIIAIVLAIDVLYFYEAGVKWLHQKRGYKTLFHHEHPV